jgi:surface polysaccharide O-acyltransferase-like enzyme
MSTHNNYDVKIALGWILLVLMVMLMFVFMIFESVFMEDGLQSIKSDPGVEGLKFLTYLLSIYALMPILVQIVAATGLRFLRWVCVAAAAMSVLFIAMHHLTHLIEGTRPSWSSNLFDLTQHVIGFWILYLSVLWARSGKT